MPPALLSVSLALLGGGALLVGIVGMVLGSCIGTALMIGPGRAPRPAVIGTIDESGYPTLDGSTISLVSGDGLVEFQFRHNVQGRSVYAEGTVDAAVFLARRVAAADARTSYTMIDVLRAGAMD